MLTGAPRRSLLAGLACVALVATVLSLTLVGGQSRKARLNAVLAGSVGAPDPSFHGNGRVLDAVSEVATGIAVVPAGAPGAGDLVVSGNNGSSFQVGRFTTTGAADPTFAGNLTARFAGAATAIAVVPLGLPGAGDVVAVGYRNGSTCGPQVPTPVVAEFLSNGALNPSFGSGGVATLSCPPQGGQLSGVVVDSAGDIDVAGEAFVAANTPSILVARLSSGGLQQGQTFSTLAGATTAQANAVAYLPSTGDVIAAGFGITGGRRTLTMAAVKNGALDTSFNPEGAVPGVVTLSSGSSASGVTVVSNKLLVAGTSAGGTFLLVRYLPTGLIDTTFGSGGQVINQPNLGAADGLSAVAYQPNGNYLSAVGFVSRNTGSGVVKSMVVAQYNATNGAANVFFGSRGATVESSGPFDATLAAVAVQSDGKTVGAGSAPVVNAVGGMALIRLGGPSLGVGSLPPRQVTSTSPIAVNFPAAINEALATTVNALFCASPGVIVNHQGGCGTVTVPAGVTHFVVPVTVPITTLPGHSQTDLLAAHAGDGLEVSSTQPLGGIVIQHLPAPAPYSGYWLVASDGGIFAFGHVGFFGSTGNIRLNRPIVGMAATPDGRGYWLVASDGGIFAFGDAHFYGSTGNVRLNRPIVGMAATPDGRGYWLVASDGGIFAFGDAHFYGSTGGIRLNKPVVGMAAAPDGRGYWLVASDGGIFAFGDARFEGSTGAVHLARPIVGMATFPGAPGYWLVASDGGIFSFGASRFHGSTGGIRLTRPVVGMASTSDGGGYWLVASDGGIFAFGDARFFGSTGGIHLTQPIVGMF